MRTHSGNGWEEHFLQWTTPYVGFQSAIDSTVVHGWNYYWKSTHLPELRDDLIDVLAEHAFACSSPRSYVALFHLKGSVSRVAEGGTAFGNRQASHSITLDGVWAYGSSVYDRLVDVKTTYDPDNVFHHNQNIRPKSSAG